MTSLQIKKTPFDELSKTFDRNWKNINKSRSKAKEIRSKIIDTFKNQNEKLLSEDVSFVLFGSIARGECNDNSDIDWTLLIDGQASLSHRQKVHRITHLLADIKPPAPDGIFGSLTFSHDLINFIGGNKETYNNLSQRILLLLESQALEIDSLSNEAYERVTSSIINRYLEDDSIFKSKNPIQKIPRFLLNDFVRFWRTMCVDFAWKQREQEGKKWAIRNIKLRLSRKLIFLAGILMLYKCYILGHYNHVEERKQAMIDIMKKYIRLTPLDILAEILPEINKDLTIKIYDKYDEFLKIMNNSSERKTLEDLNQRDSYDNKIFLKGRGIGNDFDRLLSELFFGRKTLLTKFTKDYLIF